MAAAYELVSCVLVVVRAKVENQPANGIERSLSLICDRWLGIYLAGDRVRAASYLLYEIESRTYRYFSNNWKNDGFGTRGMEIFLR